MIAGLVLGEGALRYLQGHPAPGPASVWPDGMFASDPTAGVTLRPGFAQTEPAFTVNSLGLRDVERAAPRSTHWLVLGDELAAGIGVADDAHVGRLLERGLSTAEGPAVWNGAVPRSGPEQTLMRLRTLTDGQRLDPALAIWIVNLGNDPWDALGGPGRDRVIDGRLTEMTRWAPWPGSSWNADRAALFGASRSHLVTALKGDPLLRAPSPVASLFLPEESPEVQRGWAITEEVITAAAAEVGPQRLVLVGVTPPVAHLQVGERIDPRGPARRLEALGQGLVVLTPELDSEAWAADRPVLSAAGHRALSLAILDGLRARGLGPRTTAVAVEAALGAATPTRPRPSSRRAVASRELARLIVRPPLGWELVGGLEAGDGPLGIAGAPPLDTARVRVSLRGPEDQVVRLSVFDALTDPAVDGWLRAAPGGTPGRRVVAWTEPHTAAVLDGLDAAAFEALEASLAPEQPNAPRVLRRSEPEPPPEQRRTRQQPAALAPALPPAPDGWAAVDRMTRWDEEPWVAVAEQWYRGPAGAFAARITDGAPAPPIVDAAWGADSTVDRWVAVERRGACTDAGFVRRCVLPLDDRGRLLLTLDGPIGAPERAFSALAAGLRLDRLPRVR